MGLLTGKTCAFQMLKAYETVALGKIFPHADLVRFLKKNVVLRVCFLQSGYRKENTELSKERKSV